MNILHYINLSIAAVFLLCYFYQFIYIPITIFNKDKKVYPKGPKHNFAVFICARNEAAVIGDLIKSIKNQTYPQELITVFVMADNCTDNTAEISEQCGAKVYIRNDTTLIGKGYALNKLIENVKRDYGDVFDAYFVFDADNVLEPDYIDHMNDTFSCGYEIVTSYRNSKNYGDNWISAGYALWFLRESRYLNHARSIIGSSCAVSGTGFMFSRKILNKNGGWPYHLLTEDIEFSIAQVIDGETIGFAPDAVLYDEQPVSFKQSWRQRMRWSKGYYQVFGKYGKNLLKGAFKGRFSCYDMSMSIMPAIILTVIGIIANISLGTIALFNHYKFIDVLKLTFGGFSWAYFTVFIVGLITVITENKNIHVPWWKKILYTFTFPFFMFTYIPISCVAAFKKVTWKPIEHHASKSNLTASDKKDEKKADGKSEISSNLANDNELS